MCGTSSAPTAAETIGGTTGMSHPPKAPSWRTSSAVNSRNGTATAVTNPRAVPTDHSTQAIPTARPSPMYCCPTSRVAAATAIRAIGGAPKNWIAMGSSARFRRLSGCCTQFRGMKTSSASSSTTEIAQAAVVMNCGTATGRVAPAEATMAVPITEANQLGPMRTFPSIGDPSTPNHREIQDCCGGMRTR